MATFYPSTDIRYKVVDGLVVLLDLRVEQYTILNRTATSMWQALLFINDPQERVCRLEQEFSIAVGQLAEDLEEFAKIASRGVICNTKPRRALTPRKYYWPLVRLWPRAPGGRLYAPLTISGDSGFHKPIVRILISKSRREEIPRRSLFSSDPNGRFLWQRTSS